MELLLCSDGPPDTAIIAAGTKISPCIDINTGLIYKQHATEHRYDSVPSNQFLHSSALGTTTSKIPTVPVPMSSMSSPVKSTIDGITAVGGDSAAYHAASEFAGASHAASLSNPHGTTASQIGLGSAINTRTRRLFLAKPLVNVNALGQDVAVFTGLPAVWGIENLWVARPTASLLTVVKAGLYSGTGATGTAIVASQLIACGLGLRVALTVVAGVRNATYTFPALYLNNGVALGLPATAFFLLELIDYSD